MRITYALLHAMVLFYSIILTLLRRQLQYISTWRNLRLYDIIDMFPTFPLS